MSWTKRDIIRAAFEEIGLGSYAYDAQAEDYQGALRRLNALVASWSGSGANTGYPSNNTPDTDEIDSDSNLPADAVRGVICGLACDIAPSYGKQASPSTMTAANAGRLLMMRKSAVIPEKRTDLASIPAGAGHKLRHQINLSDRDTEQLPGEGI